MAEKKTETRPIKPETLPSGARSFKRTGEPLTPFLEGEEIRGKFLEVRDREIRDKSTGKMKTIRVYVIELPDGTLAKIGSRALLDDAYDDVIAVLGTDGLRNKQVSFIRGEDLPNTNDDMSPTGTYEIIVY